MRQLRSAVLVLLLAPLEAACTGFHVAWFASSICKVTSSIPENRENRIYLGQKSHFIRENLIRESDDPGDREATKKVKKVNKTRMIMKAELSDAGSTKPR